MTDDSVSSGFSLSEAGLVFSLELPDDLVLVENDSGLEVSEGDDCPPFVVALEASEGEFCPPFDIVLEASEGEFCPPFDIVLEASEGEFCPPFDIVLEASEGEFCPPFDKVLDGSEGEVCPPCAFEFFVNSSAMFRVIRALLSTYSLHIESLAQL